MSHGHTNGKSNGGVPTAPHGEDALVDETSKESFPASDPPAWTATHAGTPRSRVPPEFGWELRLRLRADVEFLASRLGERNDHADRPYLHLREAADYIARRFHESGRSVTRYPFGTAERPVENIELEIVGRDRASEVVVIGAHYDSVVGGPGADDNASGVAVLLALARDVATRPFSRTVRLVAFANEERPHAHRASMGSVVYAKRARSRRDNIVGMLSLETLGFYSERPRDPSYPLPLRLFSPWRGDAVAFVANRRSRGLLREVKRAFRDVARVPSYGAALPAFLPWVRSSDHHSFWKQRYPALMVTDTAPFRYRHYHTKRDTPDRLNYETMAELVPALAAVLVRVAGTPPSS